MVGQNSFMLAKVKKQILRNGLDVIFSHWVEDKYHDRIKDGEISVRGIFHQATSYQSKTSGDGSVTTNKPSPMLLCLYEAGKDIAIGDTCAINGKDMTVTGVDNIDEENIALNISLEVNE